MSGVSTPFTGEISAVVYRACVFCGMPNPNGEANCPHCGTVAQKVDLGVIASSAPVKKEE